MDDDDSAKLKKLPLKKTDFSITGPKAQLQGAVALTCQEPNIDDYDKYPLPSSKQIAAEKRKLEDKARKAEEEARKNRNRRKLRRCKRLRSSGGNQQQKSNKYHR